MPIYEYQCSACAHQLEALQKMTDEPLKECPVCHQAALTRLVSAAGFQLKGTGWYATDYRPKSGAASEEKPASPAAEAKPAADKPVQSDKKGDS